MKTVTVFSVVACVVLSLSSTPVQAQTIKTIQNFDPVAGGNPTNMDGAGPLADLLLAGETLFGTAPGGGTAGSGTLFSLNTNGAHFSVLHTFSNDFYQANPQKHLVLSVATLYGVTGSSVFSIGTNGTSFHIIYMFTNYSVGAGPGPGLVLAGDTLYGTAVQGGTNANGNDGRGTIFSLNTNGQNVAILHSFTGGADGQNPLGCLTLSGDTLYGTAYNGGTNSGGTIFSLKTNGAGFTVLHAFGLANHDGEFPSAAMLLAGATLYGTTSRGGTNNQGTVFSISTNGLSYSILHHFKGAADGGDPEAGLTISDNTLYGVATGGGTSGAGTVFSLNTNGASFTVFHNFTGSPLAASSDGAVPRGNLVLSGNVLYGTTARGGTNAVGTVFSLTIVPIITGIGISGSDILLQGINGVAGHTYTVLSSTDHSVPRAAWIPIATNVLDNGGNFSLTVTNAAAPTARQRFFTVQAQ